MPHPQTRRSSHPGSSCLPATGLQSMTTSPRSRFPHQTLWDASFPWFPSYFTRHLLVTLVGPPHLSLQTLDKPRLRSWASLFSNYTHPLGELKESHGWKVTEMLMTLQAGCSRRLSSPLHGWATAATRQHAHHGTRDFLLDRYSSNCLGQNLGVILDFFISVTPHTHAVSKY